MSSENNDPTLRVTRVFEAPCERVFEALVEPALMRGWMFSDPDTQIDIDLCVGGEWSIRNQGSGKDFAASGRYVEIDRPRRLVYTLALPQLSANNDIVTIGLEPEAGACRLTLTQTGVDIDNELRQLAPGEQCTSEASWRQGFNSLERFLAGNAIA